MLTSTTYVKTDKATKYVAQLCKHFKHKVPAQYTEAHGQVDFQPGDCELNADPTGLHIRCSTDDENNLGRLEFILEDHLKRFAWREDVEIIWTRTLADASKI